MTMIQIQALMYFILSCACGLSQYGSLLLNESIKSPLWKRGIYAGMAGSGYSAFGFLVPRINPAPCLSFFLGTAIMLGCVVVSYYQTPAPDSYTIEQKEHYADTRQSALRQLAVGVCFALILATITAFTKGQQDGQIIQQSFANVVGQLANEVKSLHSAVNTLTADVKQLKIQARREAVADSIARRQSATNQARLLRINH